MSQDFRGKQIVPSHRANIGMNGQTVDFADSFPTLLSRFIVITHTSSPPTFFSRLFSPSPFSHNLPPPGLSSDQGVLRQFTSLLPYPPRPLLAIRLLGRSACLASQTSPPRKLCQYRRDSQAVAHGLGDSAPVPTLPSPSPRSDPYTTRLRFLHDGRTCSVDHGSGSSKLTEIIEYPDSANQQATLPREEQNVAVQPSPLMAAWADAYAQGSSSFPTAPCQQTIATTTANTLPQVNGTAAEATVNRTEQLTAQPELGYTPWGCTFQLRPDTLAPMSMDIVHKIDTCRCSGLGKAIITDYLIRWVDYRIGGLKEHPLRTVALARATCDRLNIDGLDDLLNKINALYGL
ncbi:hypothetical protein QBC46DRAFT_422206 [Diplogelasinospora grovesii]|uniref:Uncharacterized protein n=1 Tax=Diplogelasinospora grovesii TaxID=303347 RepID=A0AAN6NC68_9PEZI|nr:hypothetical protein QBC46DRAFT_422206 [Diplogelasinospora grovesii]